MAEKQKGLGQTVLGWFVVRPEDEGAAEQGGPQGAPAASRSSGDALADDLIARYAGGGAGAKRPTAPPARGPAAPAAGSAAGAKGGSGPSPLGTPSQKAAPGSAPAAPAPGGPTAELDFSAIFKKGGLSPEEQGHVERARLLLQNLPKETPQETKRQIVEASLMAFGFPVDRIIESAALHLKVLDEHIQLGQKQTQFLLEESNKRLQQLEQEAQQVKKIMQDQLASQQGLTTACNHQKLKVQEVLEFFGMEAVERVVNASAKLRPQAPASSPPAPKRAK